MPVEALEERRVLAVDGQEQPSSLLPRGDGEISCRDETLLVREREGHAPLERPQRCADACEAHDGVQDEVGLGCVEKLREIAPDADVLDAERPARSSRGCDPDARAQTVSSGVAAITSSACRPMDPVAPSRAIRRSRTVEG